MTFIQNRQELKDKIIAFLTKCLADFTRQNPTETLEAIGLDLDSYAGIAHVSVGTKNFYQRSIAQYLTLETTAKVLSEKTITELKDYLADGYVYHLTAESLKVVNNFKISMGDWSHVAFKSLQLLKETELENLRKLEIPDGSNYMTELKQLASEALIDYLQTKAFKKVNKESAFIFLVQDVNDSVEDAVLKFNKVRRTKLRFIKNEPELRAKILDWVTEKMTVFAKEHPEEKIYSIGFDMDCYQAMTYLSVNTKAFCIENEAKIVGTPTEDYYGKGNYRYALGNYKYTAFEEIKVYEEAEISEINAIEVIEGNWCYSTELYQIFAETLLDFQQTDSYKKLNLEADAFVFGTDHDTSLSDALLQFERVKNAYV